jgi:putative transposase
MRKHYTDAFKAQMVRKMLKEEKTITQLASEYGIHPTQLHKWKAMAIKNLPNLFSDERKAIELVEASHEQKVKELYAEIGKLTTQLTWLKKNPASTLSRVERLVLVDRGDPEMSLTVQVELLSINRSSLYYQPALPSPREVAIKHRIDEIYTKCPFYGSRRIKAQICRENITVGRKTVQRYMQEMEIAGISPGPNLSKRNIEHQLYPYLLRKVTIDHPDHVWGIDITYIRLKHGWMYLVAILDWFSRFVVAWELEQTLELLFVLTAVDHALSQATPAIWNSDQGSHFTSPQYLERLSAAGVHISMDGRGRAAHNIFTERLWRSVKYEEV